MSASSAFSASSLRSLFRGRRGTARLFDDELVVDQRSHLFDTLRRAVPFEDRPFDSAVEQPFGLDRRDEANQRQAVLAAFFDIDGDQEFVTAILGFRARRRRTAEARRRADGALHDRETRRARIGESRHHLAIAAGNHPVGADRKCAGSVAASRIRPA